MLAACRFAEFLDAEGLLAQTTRIGCDIFERNAMGATIAINASRIALRAELQHLDSLDKVIQTMRDTGADTDSKYKETSRGGLVVNVIVC